MKSGKFRERKVPMMEKTKNAYLLLSGRFRTQKNENKKRVKIIFDCKKRQKKK